MDIKENLPSNNIRENELKICSENNNPDLLLHLYKYNRFSGQYYSNVEFSEFVPNKSIHLFHNSERQDDQKQNHEIMIKQVNTADLNITDPQNTINYTYTVNPYSYYSIDINRIPTLKKYKFYIEEYMYKGYIKYSQRSEISISENNIPHFKVKDKENKSQLNFRKKRYLCNGEPIHIERLKPRETSLSSNCIQGNSLDMRYEGQGIDLKISLCKYSLPKLFNTLFQMCNSRIQLTPDAASVNMFSLSVGYWYFQNISQGYILKLLLRNVNVSTLSVMMQLYFIIITHVHPNLTIQINYRRKPELLAVHETLLINTFSFKSIEWCENHKVFFKSTMLHFPNVYIEERHPLPFLCAIPYANTENSHSESLIQVIDYEQQSQSEYDDNIVDSASRSEDEDSTIFPLSLTEDENDMIPFESESEIKPNPPPPAPYKKYSDIFRLDNFANFKDTSWTSSLENLSALHKDADELKKTNIQLLNILFSCGVSHFSFIQSKLWVTGLRQQFDALKMFINLHDVLDSNMINESMFEETSVNLYEKYCKPILSQKFVVITLHNLGKSLGNILFNMN